MDLSQIENNLANIELDVEKAELAQEAAEVRAGSISEALSRLENDAALLEKLEAHAESAQAEIERAAAQKRELVESVNQLHAQLEEEKASAETERRALEELVEVEVDASEAMAILEEKESRIREDDERLQELAARLGISLEEMSLGESVEGRSLEKADDSPREQIAPRPSEQLDVRDAEHAEDLTTITKIKEGFASVNDLSEIMKDAFFALAGDERGAELPSAIYKGVIGLAAKLDNCKKMKAFLESLEEGNAGKPLRSKARGMLASGIKAGIETAKEIDEAIDIVEHAADALGLDEDDGLRRYSAVIATGAIAAKKQIALDDALSLENLEKVGKVVSYARSVCDIGRVFVKPTPKNAIKAVRASFEICGSTCNFLSAASGWLENYNGNRPLMKKASFKMRTFSGPIWRFDKGVGANMREPRFYRAYHRFRSVSHFFELASEAADAKYEEGFGILENAGEVGAFLLGLST